MWNLIFISVPGGFGTSPSVLCMKDLGGGVLKMRRVHCKSLVKYVLFCGCVSCGKGLRSKLRTRTAVFLIQHLCMMHCHVVKLRRLKVVLFTGKCTKFHIKNQRTKILKGDQSRAD